MKKFLLVFLSGILAVLTFAGCAPRVINVNPGKDYDVNLDVLGYIDPDITVSIIKDGQTVEKKKLALPKKLINVKKCKNPRCITSTEPGIVHIFKLADEKNRIYRCIYCEADK